MSGTIDILAVRGGHDTVELPEDGGEAKKKVDDLLGKKYTLFISVNEGDKKVEKKVSGFDSTTNEYLVKEMVDGKETESRYAVGNSKVTAVAPTMGG